MTINPNSPAFPMRSGLLRVAKEGVAARDDNVGLPAIAYAAIQLRVPMSGIPWLDDMIREARRMDAAERAMQGFMAQPDTRTYSSTTTDLTLEEWRASVKRDDAAYCVAMADALQAELGKDRK